MISQWFAAPKAPTTHKYWPSVLSTSHKESKAQRQGISVEEYERRCKLVDDALLELEVNVGDFAYPPTQKDFENHGRCVVTAIARSYDDYGRTGWDPNKLFLVHFRDEHNKVISCTSNYLSKNPPTSFEDPCKC
jgi:hypothetical protein